MARGAGFEYAPRDADPHELLGYAAARHQWMHGLVLKGKYRLHMYSPRGYLSRLVGYSRVAGLHQAQHKEADPWQVLMLSPDEEVLIEYCHHTGTGAHNKNWNFVSKMLFKFEELPVDQQFVTVQDIQERMKAKERQQVDSALLDRIAALEAWKAEQLPKLLLLDELVAVVRRHTSPVTPVPIQNIVQSEQERTVKPTVSPVPAVPSPPDKVPLKREESDWIPVRMIGEFTGCKIPAPAEERVKACLRSGFWLQEVTNGVSWKDSRLKNTMLTQRQFGATLHNLYQAGEVQVEKKWKVPGVGKRGKWVTLK